ncbi:FecR family protein [Sphingopyxis sp. YR583]|uniref:FecR family protein n=1 Tax=Sphingopyxis sp. YR583 TaxID=1881047 RepID=UPI0008A7850A|nr:FecR domain-containing protein [Sphingopyxis sp. YR583]SEH14965.1 FecR family protein [Sphingopyxis sp. YR583]
MARSLHLDDSILVQAGEWYALSLSDEVTGADLDALEVWLDADPRHESAFDLTARTARQLGEGSLRARLVALSGSEAVRVAETSVEGDVSNVVPFTGSPAFESSAIANENEAVVQGKPRVFPRPRVRWAAMSALAASLVLAVSVGVFERAPIGQPVSTAIAQTRVLTLPDGSRVTLGPDSRIATHIDGEERRVTLMSGEAFFEVAHDRSRPFWVEAGDARIQVVGTKFDVTRSSGRVHVSVLEGVVKVHEPSPLLSAAAVVTLRKSQKIEIVDSTGFFAAPPAAAVMEDPVPAGEWRRGTRTYIDTRLGDVVSDLNRYYGPGVRISDPALADVRIAMELRPSDVDAFFDVLPLIAPVKIEKNRDGAVVVERAR